MFKNRKDAAEKLALALAKYRNTNSLVVGIPKGGVETAFYVADYLNAEMSVVVTRKLGYPSNPEAAFGAIAEDGSLYISKIAIHDITQEEINQILKDQKKEITRRVNKLRSGEPLPDMNGRTVILV
ncbi:MAG: phosphoribosyltransferase, partial [Marivirga sp.]|nr:phosphoribosyltransferase [Marivirga sp.]